MARVYSSNFGQLHDFSGLYAFNVPDDQVLVLRDVELYCRLISGTEDQFELQGDLGQVLWRVTTDGTTDLWSQWQGRVVLGAGQQLYVYVPSGAVDCTLSGYLLDLP